MLSGFNLLLTGYGSKYNLLTEFITRALDSEKVLVVQGFHAAFKLTEFLQVFLTNGWNVHTDGMKQEVLVSLPVFSVM